MRHSRRTKIVATLGPSTEGRLFPKWVAVAGLVCCTSLAFFVEPLYWSVGLGLIVAGLAWHYVAQNVCSTDS